MSFGLAKTYSTCRNFLAKLISREFLIFLFFLVLSGAFWLILTLNETYEREVTIEMKLVNVPRNVVITNDINDTIHIVVRDKGYMIANYLYGDHFVPMHISFMQYADGKGHGVIPIADIQKQVNSQLYNSSKIVSIKSGDIEFFYNYGQHKKVPVRLSGRVNTGATYYLAQTQFLPDSVTVYASKHILDSIRSAYTVTQRINGLSKPRAFNVALKRIRGARFEPAAVTMKLYPDILTEEIVEVPILTLNVPDDKVLRVFPPKIGVRFVVGVNQLRHMPKDKVTKAILPNGFKVYVDYQEIEQGKSDRCHVTVGGTPPNVRSARTVTDEVDYLIESK